VDLFSKPLDLRKIKMIKDLDLTTLDNPPIQVVWEDYPENFTQEKLKSVKHYFQKKYNTTSVNVVTKLKKSEEDKEDNVDVSINIMDKNYQHELLKSILESKGQSDLFDEVIKIDNAVENKMLSEQEEIPAFKKWYIKTIEFSNFLSYGEKQKIEFSKLGGITVIESDPPNFGGKTILSVDLLLFLFFNTTTKTNKVEEIFNRYSDSNKVYVEGQIVIDGEDYIIVRELERKKAKSGEWNVKTELDFFKKYPDGSLVKFTGEQRKETENFIKLSIGEYDDFLMTILTTGSNLEDLLESKPTARGQVISRFLGLDFLKRKEETGKQLYSEFSKSMISNIYNTESLKQEIEQVKENNENLKNVISEGEKKVEEANERLKKGQEYRDNLLKSKVSVDKEIALLNPENTKNEIKKYEFEIDKNTNDRDNVKIVEPKEYYHEDQHDKIKDEYNKEFRTKIEVESKIKEIEKLKSSVSGGIKCEYCGIELMNAAITQSKIAELDGFVTQKGKVDGLIQELSGKEQGFIQLKKEFDEYEKNKLVFEKYQATIESLESKKILLEDKLKRYYEVQDIVQKNNNTDSLIVKADIRINELKTELSNAERTITNANFEISKNNEKVIKNLELIDKIKDEQAKESKYKIYLELYGKNGISKRIMKNMMPLINSELQRLLQDSCYFRLEVRISEKNEVEFWMIDNNTQVEKLMASGSGYEKTIASLALRAVLSKVCSLPKPNIVVFDEVFGKISNDNLEMVYEFFIKIKEYFENILVITHNPLISQWADNTIKVKKIDNISKIVN
jgi:DNA repair exonuclease SbcCD ATPase subunit